MVNFSSLLCYLKKEENKAHEVFKQSEHINEYGIKMLLNFFDASMVPVLFCECNALALNNDEKH